MKRSNCATSSADRQRRRKHLARLAVLIALSFPGIASAAGEVLYVLQQCNSLLLALDPQTFAVEASIRLTRGGTALAAMPDGRRLYVLGAGRQLAVIDTSTNEIVATVDLGVGLRNAGGDAAELGASARPLSVGVTPNGSFLYVPNTPFGLGVGRIAVVSTVLNSVVAQIDTPYFPTATAVTPDGAHVLVLANRAQPYVVTRISTASNEIVGETGLASEPTLSNIAFSPDGSLAYVCTRLGLVALDTTTFAIASEVAVFDGCDGIAVRPDGERIYVGRLAYEDVAVVDAAENEIAGEIPVAPHPRGLATSLDGSRLFVTSTRSSELTVIDTATDEVLTTEDAGGCPTDLVVVLVPPPLQTPTAGGCSVAPEAQPLAWATVLLAAVLLIGMRRLGPIRSSEHG